MNMFVNHARDYNDHKSIRLSLSSLTHYNTLLNSAEALEKSSRWLWKEKLC